MKRLVSIDPGARSGVALWVHDEQLAAVAGRHGGLWLSAWQAVAMPPNRQNEYLSIVTKALQKHGVDSETTVIVEGQWAIDRRTAAGRRSRAASGHDVIALVERRCAWQYAAEQLTGWATEVIQPRDWMIIAKRCPGATPGERVQWLIQNALGVRTGLDEAAAIGLGLWWLQASGRATNTALKPLQ